MVQKKDNGHLQIKENNIMISYICEHVWENEAPAVLVIHDEDGYQILCSELHEGTTPHVMPLDDFLQIHPQLKGIQFLKEGHLIERVDINHPWIIKYHEKV